MTPLLIVSNCEISKITVHANGGSTVNGGNVSSDAEAQSVPGEGERANLDSWLRYDLESMFGQAYAETLPPRNRNI